MIAWHCTPCAILVTGGFPFEEKSIGGAGKRTCVKCGVERDRVIGMHLITVDDSCKCEACSPNTLLRVRMTVCQTCGNKRCPKAAHHGNVCTNSNEPDQPVKPVL